MDDNSFGVATRSYGKNDRNEEKKEFIPDRTHDLRNACIYA